MQVRALLASGEYPFPELGCLKQKLKGKLEPRQSMWRGKQHTAAQTPAKGKNYIS